ncbi:hypothetical protein HDU88_007948 [Geranomyces variabilis]|nr:hypothetical protein HDU88_007948 [Geranomyces variabilis]
MGTSGKKRLCAAARCTTRVVVTLQDTRWTCYKAGIWRRLQKFTKARAYLVTALQTGDVIFVKAVIQLFEKPGEEQAVSSWKHAYCTYVSKAAKAGQLDLALYRWDHAKLICQTTKPGVTPMLVENRIGEILREAAAAGMPALCRNNYDGFATTPLMNAAAAGKLEAVKLLLAHEADVNAEVGSTIRISDFIHQEARMATSALCAAARNGHVDICMALLRAGADPHRDGDLAIHLASHYGHEDIVRMFLDAGVAADVPRGKGFPFGTATALYHACRGSRPAVIRLLRTRGALITHIALVTAIAKPDEAVSAAILEHKAPEFSMRDIYACSTYPPASVSAKESPLARAVQCGKWSLFWELLNCYGADVTVEGYAALLAALARFAGRHAGKEREPLMVIIECLLNSELFKVPSPQLEAFRKKQWMIDVLPDAIARVIREGLEAVPVEEVREKRGSIVRPVSEDLEAVPAGKVPYDPKDGFRFTF